MKWFFCFHLGDATSPRAILKRSLIQVTVTTAVNNTSLEPYCICDDCPKDLAEWIAAQGVTVVPYRSPMASAIRRVWKDPTVCGIFLRLHIPAVAAELGIGDEHVLYTDYDVMFMRDVVPSISKLKPQLFSAAVEVGFDRVKELRRTRKRRRVPSINSGVILMNLPKLRESYDHFISWTARKCRNTWSHDQTAYNRFYGPPRKFGGVLWDELPFRYNWKPCWGLDGGDIIHFHGPKPYRAAEFLAQPDNGTVDPLRITRSHPLLRGEYFKASAMWQEIADRVRLP